MSEQKDIERVVRAVAKAPPKTLLIIELVNRYTIHGQLDYDSLEEAQTEVNMAVVEAKMYGAYTMRAVQALEGLEAIPADVGFRDPSIPQ